MTDVLSTSSATSSEQVEQKYSRPYSKSKLELEFNFNETLLV